MLMTDTVLISLVGAAATVTLAIVNGVFAMMANARSKRNEDHLVENKAAIEVIKNHTDGMTERIATLAGEKGALEGHAQGVIEGAAAEKCRFKGDDTTCKFSGAV